MKPITVAAAQSPSARGDLAANVATHLRFVEAAARAGTDLLVFPELSLTGYELDLAPAFSLRPDDARIEPLRAAARRHAMHVLVGCPWASGTAKPWLGAFLLSAGETVCYAKVHVHESESGYFAPGSEGCVTTVSGVVTGIAICADTARPSHPAAAAAQGAGLYVAGIMKTADEYAPHALDMERYAARHAMATLTANYAGFSGGAQSGGGSAIWDERGALVARADSATPAMVVGRRAGADGGWRGEVVGGF